MKKFSIVMFIIDILFILFVSILFIFRDNILDNITSRNMDRLAYFLYSDDLVLESINRRNRIGFISDINLEDYYGDTTNLEEDKYDLDIRSNKENKNYKLIETEISGFKSYLVVIYDPSKVKLVTSRGFNQNNTGHQILSDICSRYDAEVCINGGGFVDYGSGSDIPIGVVIEDGKIKWDDKRKSCMVAFNKENKLVLFCDTADEALKLGIRDALEFGPFLIQNGEIKVNNNDSMGGYSGASRVAIGQRSDGIVLFLVTEGRHGNGPTIYEAAEFLKKYGVVNAGNLDGGASSSLVIENKLVNNPLNIYGQPVNGGRGRTVVTGFGLIK